MFFAKNLSGVSSTRRIWISHEDVRCILIQRGSKNLTARLRLHFVRARGSSTRDSKDFDSFILGSFAGLAAIPFASGEPPMASIFFSAVARREKG
jgi:hypothetical protein